MQALRLILIFLSIFIIFIIFILNYSLSYYYRSGPNKEPSIVLIQKGLGLREISNVLYEKGILVNPKLFNYLLIIKRLDNKLKAGEYLFPENVSPKKIFETLTEGKNILRSLTIIEGETINEIIKKIKYTEGLTGIITDIPEEGEVLPETYYFSWGEKRQKIIDLMKKSMSDKLNEEWIKRSPGIFVNNKKEAIILASIIEKETSLNYEKQIVSSVFHNRLRIGMRLQSDPTVIYGMMVKNNSKLKKLSSKDIKIFTKYNTYLIDGLPPGPISNPGIDSIYAALNPKNTDYFYFVADGRGGHNFAKSFSEHLLNIKRWKKTINLNKQKNKNN